MIRYECDKCGMKLSSNSANRYIVKMEVYAAAGPIDLELETGTEGQLEAVIEQLRHADPDEIEDQTYRSFRFDLCNRCRRIILSNPLGLADGR